MSRVVVVGSFNVDHVWTTATLPRPGETLGGRYATGPGGKGFNQAVACARSGARTTFICALGDDPGGQLARALAADNGIDLRDLHSTEPTRSEEHTSELQSLMRISYAVFCLKKKKKNKNNQQHNNVTTHQK